MLFRSAKLFTLLGICAIFFTACDTPEECKDESAALAGAGAVPGSEEDFKTNVKDRVFFRFARHDVSEDAQKVLGAQAAWLKTHGRGAVVEGHCDKRGTRDYNLALGERRANSAKDVLVSNGVDPQKLSAISYGKDKLPVQGDSVEANAQNRTAITVIQ